MTAIENTEPRSLQFAGYIWLLAIFWTLAVAVMLIWNVLQHSTNSEKMAHTHAWVAYSKDIIYYNWNALHGRVYVPVTREMPPSPYLAIDDRDVVTRSGVRLTLVTPAYMIRQANELGSTKDGISVQLTSLKPIRPKNTPDAWETKSLRAFGKGVAETSNIEKIAGSPYMRFMRPLMVEKSCLRCHTNQGYKVGDVMGGISVSVPARSILTHTHTHTATMVWGYGLLWVLGLAGIAIGARRLGRSNRKLIQANAALRMSSRQWQKTFNAIKDGISLMDNDGRILQSNRAMTAYFQKDAVALNSPRCWEVVHGTTEPLKKCPFTRMKTSRRRESLTLPARDRWLRITADPIFNAAGKLSGCVHIISDITKQHRAKEKLRYAKITAEAAHMAKTNFLAGMSHELRTPLNAIIGFSEILQDQSFGKLNEKQERYVNHIVVSGKQLSALVKDILEFSGLDQQGLKLEIASLDMKQLLKRNFLKVANTAKELDIHLVLEIADEPGDLELLADQNKIDKVVRSLLSNAVKFTGAGGSIHLSATLIPDSRLSELTEVPSSVGLPDDAIVAEKTPEPGGPIPSPADIFDSKGDWFKVTVRDTGIGIAPENHARIFEDFHQIQGGYRGKTPGTGLGLSLSKRIIELHGGRIWLESKGEGYGSSFSFVLPVAGLQAAPGSRAASV